MDIQSLEKHARQVRRDIITMVSKAGAGHPGGSLSCTDALVALYFEVMKNIDPKDDKNPNRDRFVLSKGHAAMRTCTRSRRWTAPCRAIRTLKNALE